MEIRNAVTHLHISCFGVEEPPYDGRVHGDRILALATAHLCAVGAQKDDSPGTLIRHLHGRGSAGNELDAMLAALDVVLFQIKCHKEELGK